MPDLLLILSCRSPILSEMDTAGTVAGSLSGFISAASAEHTESVRRTSFCFIQRYVGFFEKLRIILFGAVIRSYTYAYAQFFILIGQFYAVRDFGDDVAGNIARHIGIIEIFDKEYELVAAEPSGYLVAGESVGEETAELNYDAVSDVVTVCIVDGFEAVDV